MFLGDSRETAIFVEAGKPVTAHKALGGGLRISKALVKGKALAKGASKALADFLMHPGGIKNNKFKLYINLLIFLIRVNLNGTIVGTCIPSSMSKKLRD